MCYFCPTNIKNYNLKYKLKKMIIKGIPSSPIEGIQSKIFYNRIFQTNNNKIFVFPMYMAVGGVERNTIEKEYNIVAFPTIYLIGKDGKILFSHIGYGEDFGKELEKIIEKNLQ